MDIVKDEKRHAELVQFFIRQFAILYKPDEKLARKQGGQQTIHRSKVYKECKHHTFPLTRTLYVKLKSLSLSSNMQIQLSNMLDCAYQIYILIREEQEATLQGSPVFSCENYPLVHFPHKSVVEYKNAESCAQDFQRRNHLGAFNDKFPLRKQLRDAARPLPYIDSVMTLLNILCDGPIYVDRTAFAMMVGGLLNCNDLQFTSCEVFNSLAFPLALIVSQLTIDSRLSPFQCTLLKSIDFSEGQLLCIASLPFQVSMRSNDDTFREVLTKDGSIIVEFLYISQHDSNVYSHFVVLRSSNSGALLAFDMQSAKPF